MSAKSKKITVLLDTDEFVRFDRFCRDHGFKKSTLLVRLLREFLERESLSQEVELPLFDQQSPRAGRRQ